MQKPTIVLVEGDASFCRQARERLLHQVTQHLYRNIAGKSQENHRAFSGISACLGVSSPLVMQEQHRRRD